MAAKVLSPSSSGSFLDSPAFSQTRTKPLSQGLSRLDAGPPLTALRFDNSDLEEEIHNLTSQLHTPDSGFSGAASSTPLKTPESEFSTNGATPPSNRTGHRKRKTVTIDESHPSVVMISPDDLYNTYSMSQCQRNLQEDIPLIRDLQSNQSYDLMIPDQLDAGFVVDSITGWPIKRSDSLNSRDNPFLPDGELSREAEDLLSRATIIRDNFYLNEDEKRALREQQQLKHQHQQHNHERGMKLVQIADNLDEYTDSINTSKHSHLSELPPRVIEDKIQLQLSSPVAASPLSPTNGGDRSPLQSQDNGKVKDSTALADNVKLDIHDGENQSAQCQTTSGGLAAETFVGEDLQVYDTDKKQRKTCCSVM